MDKEKIEELKAVRKQLQEEIRLKELRKRIAPQLNHLEKSAQFITIYYEFENLNWINTQVLVRKRDGYTGSHGDFQIDVDDSTVEDNIRINDEEINTDVFKEQFSSLIHDNVSLIVCYQGGAPELEISVGAFLSQPKLFFSRPETWIVSSDKQWIIEYIWDQCVVRFIQLQGAVPTLIKKILIE